MLGIKALIFITCCIACIIAIISFMIMLLSFFDSKKQRNEAILFTIICYIISIILCIICDKLGIFISLCS